MGIRDTYKYVVWLEGQSIHKDVTNDLARREEEHRARWPTCRVQQVGRKTTRGAALKWVGRIK